MKIARSILLSLVAFSFLGMAKKQLISVRFHVEANDRDGEPFSLPAKFHNPDRDGFVEKIPAVSERDIRAIYPVPADDGSFGCLFQLDSHGAIGLQTVSTERRGATMIGFISTKAGRHQAAELAIDKPITDGRIFIPRGLTQLEIEALQKQFPTIGQRGKQK